MEVLPLFKAGAQGLVEGHQDHVEVELIESLFVLQYKQRLDQFDFDMILMTLDQTLSPGLEQWQYFHSSQANVKGSKNYAGVASPVVDQLLERLLAAQTREEQLAAGRALDRVLLWQHYSIPNWYLNYHRLAYRNRLAFVTTPPYTLGLSAWWLKTTEKTQ